VIRFLEKPGIYVDEMTVFWWDEFRVQVTNSSLNGALASVGRSKKVVTNKWLNDADQRRQPSGYFLRHHIQIQSQ
jgi:hypothetical protein